METYPGVAVILYLTTDESPCSPQMRPRTGLGVAIRSSTLPGDLKHHGAQLVYRLQGTEAQNKLKEPNDFGNRCFTSNTTPTASWNMGSTSRWPSSSSRRARQIQYLENFWDTGGSRERTSLTGPGGQP
ncbi:hypothetical protein EYF80_035174 [Liparis tanakae]|uniref:Uncharacterized protein n=1 Tax=Liparis tanakae TaxID=230148 RepID=A0A4Z2GPJ6_9TELE|nr:hypothetical protein EYF80_035174 [Liparis tanakae]